MKKFLACYLDKDRCFSSTSARSWYFYQLSADGRFYESLDRSPMGFRVEKIKGLASMNTVQFAQSLNSLKKITQKIDFVRSYGEKEKESFDFACPSCGWQFVAPHYIVDDFYNTFADERNKRIKCLCGCEFSARIEYVVSTKVTIKKL